MSEEVYDNLSAKEIAKILKKKIESGQLFKVTFTSEFSIYVSISYAPKTHRFTLKVERSFVGKIVDKEETNVRVPDQFIDGFGILGITPLGEDFSIYGYGTKITVFREKLTEKSAFTSLYIWAR
jgi:hypothetical protein